jgi:hypothetical protein
MSSAPPHPSLRRTAPIRPPANDHAKDQLLPPRTGPITQQPEPQAKDQLLPSPTGPITPPTKDQLLPPPTGPLVPRHLAATAQAPTRPLHAVRLNAAELLMHPFKTFYLITALLVDPRVSLVRKALFVIPIALLILAVLLPESLLAGLVGLILPLVGLALDAPINAALDWIGVALVSYALLRVFPAKIVAEYHARLFHRSRR